jgi:hypothetical protein
LEILHDVESKIQQRGVGDPEATYKIAQAYSSLGDKASALRVLRISVEGGFFFYPYIAKARQFGRSPINSAAHRLLQPHYRSACR